MINWVFAREVGLSKWVWRTVLRQFSKRVLRRDSRMTLPTGGSIILSRGSPSAGEVFVTGADIDWGAEAVFARFADPAGDFLDVGAHIGYYSLYLSPRVRRVWAFEPDGRNVPALLANLALVDNAEHVSKAVSANSGTVLFATDGGTATSHVADHGAAIDAVSLDDFVRERDARPTLIKIDVEGHDLAVLEGAREVLARHQPLVLTEFNQGTGDNDVPRLLRFLEDNGYLAFAAIHDWGARLPWRRSRRRLVAVDEAVLASTAVKMIFVTPARLKPAFEELVRTRTPL